MTRLVLLLALLLTACGVTAPPRDTGQWTTTTHGVTVTWRYVAPGSLGKYSGWATYLPAGTSCVVDLDPALSDGQLARVAAHEYGHCAQARYLLPGIPRPDLGSYYATGTEGYAETYALAYLAACGYSLRPLGWTDRREPSCDTAPDPRTIR